MQFVGPEGAAVLARSTAKDKSGMADTQAAVSQTGAVQRPKDLRALVQDMGHWRHAPEGGVNLIVISASAALPEVKRTPELIGQIGEGVVGIAAKRSGTGPGARGCFSCCPGAPPRSRRSPWRTRPRGWSRR